MRRVFAIMVMGLAVGLVSAADNAAGIKVEVKGPHICCKQCINVVAKVLGAVDGVSDIKSDIKTKTITFTAKNGAAAKAGVTALFDGGFFGAATENGTPSISLPPAKKVDKLLDVVTVKDVHVCCGQCVTGIEKVFADSGAKVSFSGKGPQKTVQVEKAASLDQATILEALRKAGFNGTVVEK